MSKDIVALLNICDLGKQWPQLRALHDVAMQDLLAANEDAKEELAARKEAADQKAAEAKAQLDAKNAEANKASEPADKEVLLRRPITPAPAIRREV